MFLQVLPLGPPVYGVSPSSIVDSVSLCSPSWTGTHYVAQGGLNSQQPPHTRTHTHRLSIPSANIIGISHHAHFIFL